MLAAATGAVQAGLSLTPWRRLHCVHVVTALAVLGLFLVTPRLWLTARPYPLIPVSPLLLPIPPPLDGLLFGLAIVLLVGSLVLPRRRGLLLAFLVTVGLLCLWDQSRWQPPMYHAIVILLLLSGRARYSGRSEDDEWVTSVLAFTVAAVYVWSGLQKLNVTFVRLMFPWFLEPFAGVLPPSMRTAMGQLGILVPFLEAGIGVALLSRRYRSLGIVGAAGLHLFVLLSLGPLGHRWDPAVWPWNVALIALVPLLFSGSTLTVVTVIRHLRARAPGVAVLVLFGVMPALSFVDLWDSYLSWTLYSGNVRDAVIRVGGSAQVPPSLQRFVRARRDGRVLDVFAWSVHTVGLEPYPEPRVYRALGRHVCRMVADTATVDLVIEGKPASLSGRREMTSYSCAALTQGVGPSGRSLTP